MMTQRAGIGSRRAIQLTRPSYYSRVTWPNWPRSIGTTQKTITPRICPIWLQRGYSATLRKEASSISHHDLASGPVIRGDLRQGDIVRRHQVRCPGSNGGARALLRNRHRRLHRRKLQRSLRLRLHRKHRQRCHRQRLRRRRRLLRRRRHHRHQRRCLRRGRQHQKRDQQGRQAFRRRPQVRLRACRFKTQEIGLFRICPARSHHVCRSRT